MCVSHQGIEASRSVMQAELSELSKAKKKDNGTVHVRRTSLRDINRRLQNLFVFPQIHVETLLKKKEVWERGMCCREWTTRESGQHTLYNMVKCAFSHATSDAEKTAIQKKDPDAKQMEGDNQDEMRENTQSECKKCEWYYF